MGVRTLSSVPRVVDIEYEALVSGHDLSDLINEAYGPDGLGVLIINNIPGYKEAREALVPQSHSVAHLSDEAKAKLEHEESMWNVGWSHGREKLGDEPDFAKGSFYANPKFDTPGTPEQEAEYPFFYPRNLWPTEELPGLEPAFKELGGIMFDSVVVLCDHIDKLVESKVPTYQKGLLHSSIQNTRKIKGRLLYYYPTEKVGSEDGWIGWHNDSGFLTALTSDMFFDDTTGKVIPSPDPQGGLWIVDRHNNSVKVDIPNDSLAVQCGECLQIISGGLLVATPHCVKASRAPDGMRVGRGTFPIFIDTDMDFALSAPDGVERSDVFAKTVDSRVPPLETRWLKNGVPFVDFLGDTFRQYYEWAKK